MGRRLAVSSIADLCTTMRFRSPVELGAIIRERRRLGWCCARPTRSAFCSMPAMSRSDSPGQPRLLLISMPSSPRRLQTSLVSVKELSALLNDMLFAEALSEDIALGQAILCSASSNPPRTAAE